jgi:cell division septation protein DedD
MILPPGNGCMRVNFLEMSGRLVTVAVASNSMEAGLYRTTLEQADIPVVVADEGIVTMNWLLSNLVGGIKIQVPEDLVEEARDILTNEATPVSADEAEALARPPEACESCGSSDLVPYTGTQVRNILATIASYFLLPAPIPLKETRRQCRACGRISQTD